jgi:hypothetical protein
MGLEVGTPDAQCKDSGSYNPAEHDVVEASEEATNDQSCNAT